MIAFFSIILACKEPTVTVTGPEKQGDSVLDLRIDPMDIDSDWVQFQTPDLVIPPYSDINLCYYGTYEGPTVGVNHMIYQSAEVWTHHATFMAVYDDQFPDGAVEDCMEQGQNGMPVYSPLFEVVGLDNEEEIHFLYTNIQA